VFIFLSNTGGQLLTKKLLEAWQQGRQRADIKYEELEELIQVGPWWWWSSGQRPCLLLQ